MLHHNLPEAAVEYETDIRETLYRIYSHRKDDKDATPAEITDPDLYVDGKPRSMIFRVPRPSSRPGKKRLLQKDMQ